MEKKSYGDRVVFGFFREAFRKFSWVDHKGGSSTGRGGRTSQRGVLATTASGKEGSTSLGIPCQTLGNKLRKRGKLRERKKEVGRGQRNPVKFSCRGKRRRNCDHFLYKGGMGNLWRVTRGRKIKPERCRNPQVQNKGEPSPRNLEENGVMTRKGIGVSQRKIRQLKSLKKKKTRRREREGY